MQRPGTGRLRPRHFATISAFAGRAVDEGSRSIAKSTVLMQLVSGLVGTSSVQGVFWGPGRLWHPPQAFINQAQQMSPRDLPLFLWVDFRVERDPNGTCRLYTTGRAPG